MIRKLKIYVSLDSNKIIFQKKSNRDETKTKIKLFLIKQKSSIVGIFLAEGVGFEPTTPLKGVPLFESGALDHYATLPNLSYYIKNYYNEVGQGLKESIKII